MFAATESQPNLEPIATPVVPVPEIDQRMIETIDFSDPRELLKILEADDDEANDPQDIA